MRAAAVLTPTVETRQSMSHTPFSTPPQLPPANSRGQTKSLPNDVGEHRAWITSSPKNRNNTVGRAINPHLSAPVPTSTPTAYAAHTSTPRPHDPTIPHPPQATRFTRGKPGRHHRQATDIPTPTPTHHKSPHASFHARAPHTLLRHLTRPNIPETHHELSFLRPVPAPARFPRLRWRRSSGPAADSP